ncbi:DivIVA domain-containing protein [Saxibacter everestensis]|uniref:DivIVA domain-containing protein n=1 Tax=Saxibacter everestensis TaxID=2909229 RepID=A0ABY8QQM0_9MICO|nr:DivIVA domain-containing protein [Brevibacteriaceae bacterium ZFBP1038]
MPIWIVIGLCAAVLVLIAAVATAFGFVRGGLDKPASSAPTKMLPDPATAEDIDNIRFSLGFRGYRMDEVDAVIDRLRDQIAAQQQQLAQRPTEPRSGQEHDPGAGGTSSADQP